jgi:hypothetical protein
MPHILYFNNMTLPCTTWIHKRIPHNVKLSKATNPPPMTQQPVVGQDYPGFTVILRHTILSKTTGRWDLYSTTHNTHNRQTSTSRAGFELTSQGRWRPQIRALNRTVTGIGAKTRWVAAHLTTAYDSSNFDCAVW